MLVTTGARSHPNANHNDNGPSASHNPASGNDINCQHNAGPINNDCRAIDNHDNNRIASVLGGDVARQKMATGRYSGPDYVTVD